MSSLENPNAPLDVGDGRVFVSSIPEAGTTVEVDFGDKTIPKRFALGYWSIHGLCGPIAMMLCASKVPFTYFLFDLVERESDESRSPQQHQQQQKYWTSDYFVAKRRFIRDEGQPLFNIPFCVDRDQQDMIFQSNSIAMYLGKACGMLQNDDQKTCSQCEQLLGEIYDLRNVMTGYVYGLRGKEDAFQVLASGRKHLKKLEGWLELQAAEALGSGDEQPSTTIVVKHLLNGRITPPDFHLWQVLDQFEALAIETLGGSPNGLYMDLPRIRAFHQAFGALPENTFYLESWLHQKLPFNNCMSQFGSLPGPKTYFHGKSAKEATWRNQGDVELSSL